MLTLEKILNNLPDDLSERLISRYKKATSAYQCQKWSLFCSECGCFSEIVFRLAEWHCFNTYTPIDSPLCDFNEKMLAKFENSPRGQVSDSWRITIPRVLFSMRRFRNTRGDMHETLICPNFIDSEYMHSCMKWLLCEIIRLQSSVNREDVLRLIETIETRGTLLVWDGGTIRRVLCPGLSCRNQVLVLLYASSEPRSISELLSETEYASKSRFRNTIITNLHKKRLIECNGEMCELLPPGINEAEKIINDWMKDNER